MTHENNGLVPDNIFMSRRDQIAALALQGLLASSADGVHKVFAVAAVELADALIEALDE